MAMFTAHFDASGTKRSKVMSVAGFVATPNKWEKFQAEWMALLPPGISMFHMKDFVSSRKGWEGWKGKSTERAKLIASLVACIKSNTRKGFAVVMRVRHYNRVNNEYAYAEKFGPPYSMLGLASPSQMKKWADNKDHDPASVLCIFEDGDEDQSDFINRAREDGFNVIPQSKREIRAFDACDLAAWKAKSIIDDSYIREVHLTDPDGADRILASLNQLESIAPDNAQFSLNGMLNACRQAKIAKR
jgi:hypothetical protein